MGSPHPSIPFIGISRHRLGTDGKGVTTLAAFHGCSLNCRYCLNPQCKDNTAACLWHTPESLYEEVKADGLYFLATGGGVTFGGGEPALQSGFIREFRRLCGRQWKLNLETSLHVPACNIRRLLPVVDRFFIDCKDMNPSIYRRYTGKSNAQVMRNLQTLADEGRCGDCLIRLPLIPGFNTFQDIGRSRQQLLGMGFRHFDTFKYIQPWKREKKHAGY